MKKYGNKREAAAREAKLIEMTNPEEEEGNDNIDNEEEGGEWITEDNLHKHLAHGMLVPIVPVEREEGAELRPETNKKAVGIPQGAEGDEEDNTDFPAFDEALLPSTAELEAKAA